MVKCILVLVEGKTGQELYVSLLEKVRAAKPANVGELPPPVRDLLGMVDPRRMRVLRTDENMVIVVDCGGVENLKTYLRELLQSEYVEDVVGAGLGVLVVSMDADSKPLESVRGVLASLGVTIGEVRGHELAVSVGRQRLAVRVVVQGGLDEVGELEDDLDRLASQLDPMINEAAGVLEERLGRLTTKQRLGVYEALLVENRGLPHLVRELVRKASLEELRSKLGKYLAPVTLDQLSC